MTGPSREGTFQERFHQRWHGLHDPHVRALAWLLDAPGLLDPEARQWQGQVASLPPVDAAMAAWLASLDRQPEALHDWLARKPHVRLGRYAEDLMAYYFTEHGMLVAHGIQVRENKGATLGEFDFLLRLHGELVHWEFASKFYLLETAGATPGTHHFIGPNLADTLGAKISKIMERQLTLSRHPAAQAVLPEPVRTAQALVKGWLFYRGQTPQTPLSGLSTPHCQGFWRKLSELPILDAERYVILPRLRWLAPAQLDAEQGLDRQALSTRLDTHFSVDTAPVMIALLQRIDGLLLEVDRGFIVPDDWPERAGDRIVRMTAGEQIA